MSGGVLDEDKSTACYGQLASSTSSYLLKTVQINLILDRDKYRKMRYNRLRVEEEKEERHILAN